jgi:RimJ/RimL family protein N-acetyltransferase
VTSLGQRIRLRPLEPNDPPLLIQATSDGELWKFPFTVIPSSQTAANYIAHALAGRDAGTVLLFVIEYIAAGKIIGSTRFWKIDRENRKLEIGSTWLSAFWQRTYANTEAKYLMLRYPSRYSIACGCSSPLTRLIINPAIQSYA